MSALLAQVVDVDALLEVIGFSLIAGIGVTAAFSIAILGATRFADSRRDDHPLVAAGFAVLGTLASLACVAAVVFGIILMASKA